jgi:hypothetical protein
MRTESQIEREERWVRDARDNPNQWNPVLTGVPRQNVAGVPLQRGRYVTVTLDYEDVGIALDALLAAEKLLISDAVSHVGSHHCIYRLARAMQFAELRDALTERFKRAADRLVWSDLASRFVTPEDEREIVKAWQETQEQEAQRHATEAATTAAEPARESVDDGWAEWVQPAEDAAETATAPFSDIPDEAKGIVFHVITADAYPAEWLSNGDVLITTAALRSAKNPTPPTTVDTFDGRYRWEHDADYGRVYRRSDRNVLNEAAAALWRSRMDARGWKASVE